MALNCATAAWGLWFARFKEGGSIVCRRTNPPIRWGLHWMWSPSSVAHMGFWWALWRFVRFGGYWWMSWGGGGGRRWKLKRLRLRWAISPMSPRWLLHYEPVTRAPNVWTAAAHKLVFGWLPGKWGGRWRRYDNKWKDDHDGR